MYIWLDYGLMGVCIEKLMAYFSNVDIIMKIFCKKIKFLFNYFFFFEKLIFLQVSS